jgi:hypothetical protein
VPAHHSSSQRHPTRWALLVAVVVVAALVLVLRPAIGHSGDQAAPTTPPAVTTAVPTQPSPAPATGTPATTTPKATPARTTEAAIPDSASGRLAIVPGAVPATGPGTQISYRLEIEAGLPLDGPAIAAQVQRTLTDPRGWEPIEHVAFTRTGGPASFELILASPTLVDKLCYPLDTVGELSCRNGNKVILNARRWATAVPWYAGHLDDYRAYLVNHEVGHRLGHGHKTCPSPGAPAPVMVQQSKSLYGCRANPWPSVAY